MSAAAFRAHTRPTEQSSRKRAPTTATSTNAPSTYSRPTRVRKKRRDTDMVTQDDSEESARFDNNNTNNRDVFDDDDGVESDEHIDQARFAAVSFCFSTGPLLCLSLPLPSQSRLRSNTTLLSSVNDHHHLQPQQHHQHHHNFMSTPLASPQRYFLSSDHLHSSTARGPRPLMSESDVPPPPPPLSSTADLFAPRYLDSSAISHDRIVDMNLPYDYETVSC